MKNISLLGKWLKSINTSSKESRAQGRKIAKHLKMSEKGYRKMLSVLRAETNVLERTLCQGDWTDINYSHVPSKANLLYRKAFHKHDPEGYTKYLSSVEKGEAKINTSTIYPHEIAYKAINSYEENNALNVMWENLPDYLEGDTSNRLVVADVSGSMTQSYFRSKVRPIDVAVGLAAYLAERNKGVFRNSFITFSTSPQFVQLEGSNITDRLRNICRANWSMSTDLQAVFNLVLTHAIVNRVPVEEMPKEIYIISDMQFNCCSPDSTNFEIVKRKYARAGYPLPKLVFWNVNASCNESPVLKDDFNAVLVSGFSPRIMTNLLASKTTTPEELMLETIDSPRYERVKV